MYGVMIGFSWCAILWFKGSLISAPDPQPAKKKEEMKKMKKKGKEKQTP